MDAVDRVQRIAALLRFEAERIIALKAFFDAGESQAASEALGYFEEGHVATLVRGAALEAMAMACAKERYTLPAALKLLADQATFAGVAQRGDTEALNVFARLVDEMSVDYSRARLKDFRNYRLAHHLPDRLAAVDRAKLQHLWNLIDDTLLTIFHLGFGSGVVTVSMDAPKEVWAKRCTSYWHRLIEGPPGLQVIERDAHTQATMPAMR